MSSSPLSPDQGVAIVNLLELLQGVLKNAVSSHDGKTASIAGRLLGSMTGAHLVGTTLVTMTTTKFDESSVARIWSFLSSDVQTDLLALSTNSNADELQKALQAMCASHQ